MSICNGSKKRSNKKSASLSTAAVYPIIQNVQKKESDDLTENLASINTNGCKSNRKTQVKFFYGQKVEPQNVPYVFFVENFGFLCIFLKANAFK